jgi:hypothetical protein
MVDEVDPFAVPPPLTLSREDDLRAEIEAVAPTRYRKQREKLYADLARELPNDGDRRLLLWAIVTAHDAATDPARARQPGTSGLRKIDAAAYRRACERLEASAYQVLYHPLLKSLSPEGDVEVYSREEAICPHGRWTRYCEETYGMLVRLPTAESQRATTLRRILAGWGVDPSVQTPGQFCSDAYMINGNTGAKMYHAGSAPAAVRPRQVGRPRDERRWRLLTGIVPTLRANGCTLTESLRYAASICRCCFGDQVTRAALRQHWYRRHASRSGRARTVT